MPRRIFSVMLGIYLVGSLLMLAGCDSAKDDEEVLIEDLVVGDGARAEKGMMLQVDYAGWLTDGTLFDDGTYTFKLGAGKVIEGWDRGLVGMRVGGKRRLTIPPGLAYGDTGVPDGKGSYLIPPNATLTFEVDLLDVRNPAEAPYGR